jgi:hypothetical protein
MSDSSSDGLSARANRLYWETDRAAAEIADDLGISRSKLYALIEPLPLTRSCAECEGPLVFSNRTDREAGRGRCVDCAETTDVPPGAAVAPPVADPEPAPETVDGGIDPTAGLLLGATAGLAIGFLAGAWIRRH